MSSWSAWLRRWWRSKIADPILLILRRGTEPKQLAFSTALGFTLGVFPICGVTVFLCGVAAAILGSKCHTPSLMLANFIATPIELSLIIPFLRFGEWIANSDKQFELSSDAFKKIISGSASQDLLIAVFRVILGWLILAPVILGVLYVLFVPVYRWATWKFGIDHRKQSSSLRPGIKLGDMSPKKAAIS
ncbi:hypothetical protein KP509_18G063800 [Ceratopteris richardii]|nr:hypothetical protein KP509_18G063800 [Ceratopteris richardii]KAH7366111.1 hypothetical protein KP509_18G063800 [Ceratopteris richardii]